MIVEYKKSFLKDVRKVRDQNIRKRLESVLLELESTDRIDSISGLVPLVGSSGYYRIRIGNYRLGLKVYDSKVEVIRFLIRGEIYKRFP